MGRARVKPNIQDIKDLLIGIWVIFIAQEAGFGPLLIPCICALSLKGLKDAGIHRVIAQQEIGVTWLCIFFDKAAERHTPCTLPRQHPIRAGFNHRMQTIAPGLRCPCHQFINRAQRAFADGLAIVVIPANLAINGGEPLRAVQADHRRF